MIRQLSSSAKWDPLSRPASPVPVLSGGEQLPIMNGTEINSFNNTFVENPFDPFLLQPLGEMTNDDWTRVVDSIFGSWQPTNDLNMG